MNKKEFKEELNNLVALSIELGRLYEKEEKEIQIKEDYLELSYLMKELNYNTKIINIMIEKGYLNLISSDIENNELGTIKGNIIKKYKLNNEFKEELNNLVTLNIELGFLKEKRENNTLKDKDLINIFYLMKDLDHINKKEEKEIQIKEDYLELSYLMKELNYNTKIINIMIEKGYLNLISSDIENNELGTIKGNIIKKYKLNNEFKEELNNLVTLNIELGFLKEKRENNTLKDKDLINIFYLMKDLDHINKKEEKEIQIKEDYLELSYLMKELNYNTKIINIMIEKGYLNLISSDIENNELGTIKGNIIKKYKLNNEFKEELNNLVTLNIELGFLKEKRENNTLKDKDLINIFYLMKDLDHINKKEEKEIQIKEDYLELSYLMKELNYNTKIINIMIEKGYLNLISSDIENNELGTIKGNIIKKYKLNNEFKEELNNLVTLNIELGFLKEKRENNTLKDKDLINIFYLMKDLDHINKKEDKEIILNNMNDIINIIELEDINIKINELASKIFN